MYWVSIMAMHRRSVKSCLDAVQQDALRELHTRLLTELDFVQSLTLFGSTARGTAQAGSDIDLLVLTSRPLDNRSRHKITDIQFEINLKYGTNFSSLVVAAKEWEHGVASVLPIKRAVVRDGIPI